MSFDAPFIPRTARGDWLQRGEARVFRRGLLSFRADDLAAIGISEHVVIILDCDTVRIGIRAPRENDPRGALLRAQANKTGTRRTVNAGGAFKQLGIDEARVKGRYELTQKDGLLILNLSGTCRREDE